MTGVNIFTKEINLNESSDTIDLLFIGPCFQ